MNKAFTNFTWEDYPSENTALEAERLNNINNSIDIMDDRVIKLDSSKLDVTTANTMVKDVTFNEATGVFTVTKLNGSVFTLDTKLEKLAVNFIFDKTTQILSIILDDGTVETVDLSAFVTQYEFLESDTIVLSADSFGRVKATIKNGSITGDMLEPNYLAKVTEKADTATTKAEEAKNSATAAKTSETNARTSETNAKTSESHALSSANKAESYAVGGTGTRDGENTDNSKYYSDLANTSRNNAATYASNASASANSASASATSAATSATNAKDSATNASNSAASAATSAASAATSAANAKTSESNAKTSETNAATSASTATTKAGAAASSATSAATSAASASNSASTASTAATNASNSATSAATSATNAASSATSASSSATSASNSASTAASKANAAATSASNASSSEEMARQYSETWKGSLLPQGMIAFTQLPTSGMIKGYMYCITNAYTTDSRFKEGSGYFYPAGTCVYWTDNNQWKCLSGVLSREITEAEYNALSEAEKKNGTIYYLSDADNTINGATSNSDGMMSKADKVKLDGIEAGANKTVVDTTLSSASTNPVQNKAVVAQFNSVASAIADETMRASAAEAELATNIANEATRAKAAESANSTAIANHITDTSNPHKVTKSQLGLGNVDNTSDVNKPVSTAQQTAINTAYANAKTYTDNAITNLVGGAPSTLDTLKEIADAFSEHEEVAEALNEAIVKKADQSDLTAHTGDTTVHITPAERTNWNDSNNKKHTHSNKSVLDGITSTLVTAWNNVTNKLDKTGDASNVTNTISIATTRENLTTGEKLSTSLGKISKWFTDLKTVAFSGSYNDLSDKPSIGDGTITVKQAGSTKGTFTLNQIGSATIELTDSNTTYSTGTTSTLGLTKLYTSTGTNTDGTMTQSAIKSALDGKSDTSHTHDGRYYTETEIDTKLSTKSNTGHTHGNSEITSLDAGKITSGTISIDRLPKGALERCVVVADDTARFALTTSSVQTGDTVKVTGTGIMYFVVDDSKLSSAAGYEVYTAGSATSVPWSGVTGKPSSYTPSSHTQAISTITGLQAALDGKSDTSHTHDDRYYTESEINTKLNSKSDTSHTHDLSTMINTLSVGSAIPSDSEYMIAQDDSSTTVYRRRPMSALWAYIKSKLAAVATSGSYNDLSNKPTIPTVGNGTITITQNGTSKGTFTTNQSGNTTIALTDNNTTYSTATQSAQGLMSASDKTKLDGIATGAQVNQNAFSNVVVGSTTVAADSATDTLTLVGSNVTLTPDATNDKVTIGITKANVTSALGYTPPTTNTTYSAATSSANGLMSSTDKAKLDAITASADAVSFTQSLTSGTKVGTININGTDTILYAPTNTNTLNTAGSTNTSSKLFLIGATSQAANPQTYSHDTVYVGTDGHLYSNSKQVVNLSDTQALTNKTYNGYTLAAACAKAVTDSSSASAISTSTSLVTERDVYYGLPTINSNHSYTSSTTLFAPTSVGTSGYILKSNGSGAPTWIAQSSIAAGTASTLATARTIALGTGVSSTATSFNGSANITIPVTSIYEAYLSWGGKNITGSFSPLDAALISDLSANRFAGLANSKFTFERSSNAGSTWTTYSASGSAIVTTSGSASNANTTSSQSVNNWHRITIDLSGSVYMELRKLAIYLTTNGAGGCTCKVEYGDYSSTTVWTTATTASVSGWSGWNIINLSRTIGSSSYGNTRYLRLTFAQTSVNSSYASNLTVMKIRAYSANAWNTPSTLASTGDVYDYDSSLNATFPAKVTASGGFSGALSGNASTATTLATARTINGTSFNGSANITTANWGTARTITIGSTGKSVNGSGNVSWSLSEIGAAASSHTHSYAGSSSAGGDATNALKLSGYSASSSATGSTIALRNSNGYLFATYFNQSSSAETPTTSSYIMYANSDGYLRKSSLASIKSILGLGSAAYTASTAYATSGHTHTTVNGVYTSNGGAQPPSYVGSGKVHFNMMNKLTGLSSLPTYGDFILMDTYSGGDVPYVTAIGVIKTSSPRAYIAVGKKGDTSTWLSQAEIITTSNIGSQSVSSATTATKLGSSTVGGAAKPIYLNAGTATACSSTVGGTTTPVYMNAGQITACSYTLAKSVPSNAVFTDTHYITRLYAGASGTAANASATNPYIKITDDNTYRNQLRLVGSGATTVTSDASGNITISSTNTTYSTASTSANGLMSSSDKSKLDGITAGANCKFVETTLAAYKALSSPAANTIYFIKDA